MSFSPNYSTEATTTVPATTTAGVPVPTTTVSPTAGE